MFLLELKRAFNRTSFKAALLISLIFCILGTSKELYSHNDYSKHLGNSRSAYSEFVFFNVGPESNAFIIIFPLISSLAYSDSYLEDIKSGFIKFIYTRHEKSKYLRSKFFANFIAAGIAFALPLLLQFIFLLLTVPSIEPHAIIGQQPVMPQGLFSGFYYSHPFLYTMMWIFIYFLYSGAFASFGLSLGAFLKNKFVVLLLPFIFYNLIETTAELINKSQFSPYRFLYISMHPSFYIMSLEFILITIASFGIFYFGGLKHEVS